MCALLKEQQALEGKFAMGILVFLSLFLPWYVLWDFFLTYRVSRINGIVFRASYHAKPIVERAVCMCVSSQVHHARLTAEQSCWSSPFHPRNSLFHPSALYCWPKPKFSRFPLWASFSSSSSPDSNICLVHTVSTFPPSPCH